MLYLAIQTGLPSGLPGVYDMDDEQSEALERAVARINRERKSRG